MPSAFKLSLFTPVFKKGDRHSADNYRPIGQCSIACLVMESIVADALSAHLSSCGLLDPHQHGFTRKRSTATQLLEVTHYWAVSKNLGLPVHCVYFDFSRAFDRLDFGLLLAKLTSLGFGSRIVGWVADYLTGRSFSVVINSSVSSPGTCTSGVVQGSRIGPLLFAIYVLDLASALRPLGVEYRFYCDDLKIFARIRSYRDVEAIQTAIDTVQRWALRNGMALAGHKCAALQTDGPPVTYLLDGVPIPAVSSYKDLGVTFDSDLKFRSHSSAVAHSIGVLSSMIFRTFIVREPSYYLTLFNSLIRPRLEYCAEAWRPCYSRDVLLLQAVLNRFLRRVSTRCTDSVPCTLPTVVEIFQDVDDRAIARIISSRSIETFFRISYRSSRIGVSLYPPHVARTDIVNASFSWRSSRRVRQNPALRNLLNVYYPSPPLYKK